MSDIGLEKGSLAYEDERYYPGRGGRRLPTIIARTPTRSPVPEKKAVANPAPLGFFATGTTVFIFSLYNLQARGITINTAGVGMACFFGGLSQFMAGMWCFAVGDTFGGTAFSTYGSFWLAFTTLIVPDWGVAAAYADHPEQLPNATGMIFATFTILTAIFLVGTLRMNMALVLCFFLLDMNFLILTVSVFTGSLTLQKVAGGEGLILGLVTIYAGATSLLGPPFKLPVGNLSRVD